MGVGKKPVQKLLVILAGSGVVTPNQRLSVICESNDFTFYESYEAKESHRHERKPLKQDGVAERLHFLKGSVHCMKLDDPAAFSAAGNCMFCVCFGCSF